MKRSLVVCLIALLACATSAHGGGGKGGRDNSYGGGGNGGRGRYWRPQPVARYQSGNLRPCGNFSAIRASALVDVMTTPTSSTTSPPIYDVRYGLLTMGSATPAASAAVYSTNPCDPLAVPVVKVLDLPGSWVDVSRRRGPVTFTLSGAVQSSALPPQQVLVGRRARDATPVYVVFQMNSTTLVGKLKREY